MSQQLNRHRVRGSDTRTCEYRVSNISPAQYAHDWQGPYGAYAPSSFETIDDVEKPYGKGVWAYNPVKHQSFVEEPLCEELKAFSAMIWGNSGDGLLVQQIDNYNAFLNVIYKPTITKVFPITPGIPENIKDILRGKWFRDGVPKVRAELDLLVTLLELKDIKELWKSAKSLSSRVADLVSGLFGSTHSQSGYHLLDAILNGTGGLVDDSRGLRLPVRLAQDTTHLVYDISNSWLEYNFGWAQVARDLMGILNGLLGFRKKVEDIIIGSGKFHTWHGSYTDPNPPYEDFEGGMACSGHSWCPVDSSHAANRHRVTYDAMMHWKYGLTVKYKYSLPEWIVGLEGEIRGLFSSLGLSPGLDTIWERIPFSFVFDWFIPIGQMLQRYTEIDPFPVKYEILDICVSRRVGASATIAASERWCSGDPTPYERLTYSFYERYPDLTFLNFDIPSLRWPNLFQLSLGAALVGGRFKYKRWGRGS